MRIFNYLDTYIVDSEENAVRAPIVGNVKSQIDTVEGRLDSLNNCFLQRER